MPGFQRMALDTGGRFTGHSNDLSLGIARARRDLGCRYTLGFYDPHQTRDQRHEIRVDTDRPGLRVSHGAAYNFPSPSKRHEMQVSAAFLAPRLFDRGEVHAHLFPLRPVGPKQWDALISFDFPITFQASSAPKTARSFGAVLAGPSGVHKVMRQVPFTGSQPIDSDVVRSVTFTEPVRLPAGDYTLTVVVYDAEKSTPQSTEIQLELPPIPKKSAFVVGPLLGRPAGLDVVIASAGEDAKQAPDRVKSEAGFRPLIVQQVDKSENLAAISQACTIKPPRSPSKARVRRWLTKDDGSPAGDFAPVPFVPDGEGAIRCQRFLDLIPVRRMRPGTYRFHVALEPAFDPEVSRSEIRFKVLGPERQASEEPLVGRQLPR